MDPTVQRADRLILRSRPTPPGSVHLAAPPRQRLHRSFSLAPQKRPPSSQPVLDQLYHSLEGAQTS
eukprot:scaffold226771_cov29-Tisochrysis_lutea.AAC.2